MALTDKVCVVTGSGSGIGRATAIEMARQGGKVVVSDVNDANGESTVEEIKGEGGEAVYIHADMRKQEQIQALVDGAVESFGALHVLHNNAGVHESDFLSTDMTVQDLPVEVWDTLMDINLKGVWLGAKLAYPHIKAAGGGAIVNAGSTASVAGFPDVPGLHVCEARDRRVSRSAWRSTSATTTSGRTATARRRSTPPWCRSSGRRPRIRRWSSRSSRARI